MEIPDNWRKSSYSGEGDGNDCVEMANSPTHVAIRDTKTPAGATLTFPTGVFTTFAEALPLDNWRKSSYSGEGDGDDCVEMANSPTHVAIRDTKDLTASRTSASVPAAPSARYRTRNIPPVPSADRHERARP